MHYPSFQAGIISFKNLQEGFLAFGTKEKIRSKPNHEISSEVFEQFLTQLKTLILEIFSPDKDFVEKEV